MYRKNQGYLLVHASNIQYMKNTYHMRNIVNSKKYHSTISLYVDYNFLGYTTKRIGLHLKFKFKLDIFRSVWGF